MISEKIRDEILVRSSSASSIDDITSAIFDAITESGVDWKVVSPDDVKPVLVDAIRASRGQVRRLEPLSRLIGSSLETVQVTVG